MKKYTIVIMQAIIILILDVVLERWFVQSEKPDPSVYIGELIIIPFLFVFNLIIATLVSFFGRGTHMRTMAIVLMVNAIVSGIIFDRLWSAWYDYYNNKWFAYYEFTINEKQYRLDLDRRDTDYSISEIISSGFSVEFKRGKYEQHHDTIVLIDSSKRLYLIHHKLLGYPFAYSRITVVKK